MHKVVITMGALGWWLSFIAMAGCAESDNWGLTFLFLLIFGAISIGSNYVPDQWCADYEGLSLEEYMKKKSKEEMA